MIPPSYSFIYVLDLGSCGIYVLHFKLQGLTYSAGRAYAFLFGLRKPRGRLIDPDQDQLAERVGLGRPNQPSPAACWSGAT